jgi:hypothetical protein
MGTGHCGIAAQGMLPLQFLKADRRVHFGASDIIIRCRAIVHIFVWSGNMSDRARLRKAIDQQNDDLRLGVPSDREAAMLALLRELGRLPHRPMAPPVPDLVTGLRLFRPGANQALQLCVECPDDRAGDATPLQSDELDAWAERFLLDCDHLALAKLVLANAETGLMRIEANNDTINAWIATGRIPAGWRERADIDWWARCLGRRHEPEMRAHHIDDPGQKPDDRDHRLANMHLSMMTYQLGYPPDTVIGGCTVELYCEVLRWLIAMVLHAHRRGDAISPLQEETLIATMAADLGTDPALIRHVVSALTLGAENAAYHAAVPGVGSAPLVRIGTSWIALSHYGLTTEPLFFLTRELRRQDAEGYHNSAVHREAVFRQDLYSLLDPKRFVTSVDRVKIRGTNRDVRTDIDAVVFDRKTGTLGVFELKSQDPFARSPAALARQRDGVLYANRQISGVLDWLKRNGADEILNRVDVRTARTFRVHRVYPFVLGRYLIHFNDDGPAPDRRAAWGTWPQVLRLLEEQPLLITSGNPIASLFNRLSSETSDIRLPADMPPQELQIGQARLVVHRFFTAYMSRTSGNGPNDDH